MKERRFTKRQEEVLQLLAEGLTDSEIARRLHLSVGTARTHVKHIREALGARTRGEAVARAISKGLIKPPNGENTQF